MEKDALLRDTVAGFLGVDANAIGPDFPLSRKLAGSLARATLDAAIRRRVGVKSRTVYTARTYGELQAAILGDGSPVPSSAAARPPPTEAPDLPTGDGEHAACGVDMELVEHLPAAEDYWEHEFYRANFTRAEIAYCLTREHPREHFAARWSAKEALKKCDPIAMSLDMNEIEVTLNESGAPTLRHVRDGTFSPLHYAVSMSHTPVAAVAVVVKRDSPNSAAAKVVVEVPRAETPPTSQHRRASLVALWLVALIGVILGLIAVLRTI